MRMVINEIRYENKMIVVEGITAIGSIKGIWKDKEIPNLDNIYSVELNIKELNKNNISILSNREEQIRVFLKDTRVFFEDGVKTSKMYISYDLQMIGLKCLKLMTMILGLKRMI